MYSHYIVTTFAVMKNDINDKINQDMKFKFILAAIAAMILFSCGKNNENENSKDPTPGVEVDENGVSSILIREKGKGGDFAKEVDITIDIADITSTIEVKTDPADIASLIVFESEDVLIARVTKQGNLYARRVGSTKVNVKVGETVYATANVTITGEVSDPSDEPSEKIRLDDSHWFFWCAVCDEFEPIKEASRHSSAGHFATWYPCQMNIVLLEDINDDISYLGFEDDEGNFTYSYEVGSDTYFDIEDPDAGDGIIFWLDPSAPYTDLTSNDTFGRGSLTLSFENEKYIAGPYTCEAEYRGLTGTFPDLVFDVLREGKFMRKIWPSADATMTLDKGVNFSLMLYWSAHDSEGKEVGEYALRDFVEIDETWIYIKSDNENIVTVKQAGNSEGERWRADLECKGSGETDITVRGTFRTIGDGEFKLHVIVK